MAAIDRMLEIDTLHRLSDWKVPENAIIRRLRPDEVRLHVRCHGWCVYNETTKTLLEELPGSAFPIGFLHLDCDRCGSQWASLHYSAVVMKLSIYFSGDRYHDEWNAFKNACQDKTCYVWSAVCQLTVLYSTARAPYNTHGTIAKFEDTRDQMREAGPRDCPDFEEHMEELASDFGVLVPTTGDEVVALFDKFLEVSRF